MANYHFGKVITCLMVLAWGGLSLHLDRVCCAQSPTTKQLIANLNDRDYQTRQNAMEKLQALGLAALPDIESTAIESDDVSIVSSCLKLIVALFESEIADERKAAEDALSRMAKSNAPWVADRAAAILRSPTDELLSWIKKMNGIVIRDAARAGNPVVKVCLDRTRGVDPSIAIDSIHDSDIEPLRHFAELRELTLENRPNITDEVFSNLRGFGNLRSLNLSRTSITGKGFAELAANTKLEELDLSYCNRLQAEHLAALAQLPGLKSIKLNGRGNEGWSDDLLISSIHDVAQFPQGADRLLEHTERLRGGIPDEGVSLLAKIGGLERCELAGTQTTDSALESLAQMPHLKSLNLEMTAITDRGIELLSKSASLEDLSVKLTYLTDASVESLANLSTLRRLNLQGTAVVGTTMDSLSRLPQLEYLNLSNTLLDDVNLPSLAALSNLTEIELSGSKVTIKGLTQLATLRPNFSLAKLLESAGFSDSHVAAGARWLNLRDQPISDADLEFIEGFPSLESLDLQATNITDVGLDHLQNLTSLKSLNLRGTGISDNGLRKLAHLPKLQSLEVFDSKATFSGVRRLLSEDLGRTAAEIIPFGGFADQKITNQHELGVCADLTCRGVCDKDMRFLGTIGRLYSLKVAGNPITDDGVCHLPATLPIEVLWLSGDGISGKSLRHLAGFKKIKSLWITDANIGCHDLASLSDFRSLESLNLSGCRIDDTCVDPLSELPGLKYLIVDFGALSDRARQQLQQQDPSLKIVRTSYRVQRQLSHPKQPYVISREMHGSGARVENPLHEMFRDEYFQDLNAAHVPEGFDVSLLSPVDTITSVGFAETVVADGALQSVAELPNLKRLDLLRSTIDDSQLQFISGMTQLESLDIHRSTITEAGVLRLKNMSGLKRFVAGGYSAKLKPSFIQCLEEMPNLEELNLDRTPIDDSGMEFVAKLGRLRRLSLRETGIGDGVGLLVRLPELQQLDLSSTYISDVELACLTQLKKLQSLTIDTTFVTPKGVQRFQQQRPDVRLSYQNLPSEEVVDLIGSLRERRVPARFNANGNVTFVDLRDLSVDEDTVAILAQFPDLVALQITGPLTDRLAEVLVTRPSFQHLWIFQGSISPEQLDRFGRLPSFQGLTVADGNLTTNALAEIGDMTQLTQLSLNGCKIDGQIIDDTSLARLKNLRELTSLDLSDSRVTDLGLKTIAQFDKLMWLHMNHTQITDQGVYPVSRWPGMMEFRAEGTRVTPNEQDYGSGRVTTRAAH